MLAWFANSTLSDRIATIAILVSFFQFAVLVATVWVMVRTARRQLRAYVFADNSGLFDGSMMNPPMTAHANEPGVIISFRNSGQTPAYKVVSWAKIELLPRGKEHELVIPKIEEHFSGNISPGGTMPKTLWYGRVLTPQEITDVANGTLVIYVFGRIEYRDAFKSRRWTEFQFAYAGLFPPPPGVTFALTEKGNNAN